MEHIEITIHLDRKDKKRSEFINIKAYKTLFNALGVELSFSNVFLTIKEILKNIYDHTETGRGICFIKKYESILTFDIFDYDNEPYDWDIVSKSGYSSKHHISPNCGIGTGLIFDSLANDTDVFEFHIDTTCGFRYYWKMCIPTET
ncbi:MAG: hypothetical protein HGB03_02905 [Candidatus Yonathbacteria bacterium]|nr:hypothetical protein [Candidatus Yonathbacteria bacterium]NTW47416.1 hypothetical protein [Candidatus Yonathbacteria bacterium]